LQETVSIRNREWGKECEKLQTCCRKDVGMNRQAKRNFYSGEDAFYCGRVKEGARSGRLARRPSTCGVVENSIERSPLQGNLKYRKLLQAAGMRKRT
jgi:hypothetical protein